MRKFDVTIHGETFTIITDDAALVIATENNGGSIVAKAVCSPDDVFSLKFGIKLAVKRLVYKACKRELNYVRAFSAGVTKRARKFLDGKPLYGTEVEV